MLFEPYIASYCWFIKHLVLLESLVNFRVIKSSKWTWTCTTFLSAFGLFILSTNLYRKHQVQHRSLVSFSGPSRKNVGSHKLKRSFTRQVDGKKTQFITRLRVYSAKEYLSLRMSSWMGRAAHHMCVGSLCLLGMQLSSQDKTDEVLLFIFQPNKKVSAFEYRCLYH